MNSSTTRLLPYTDEEIQELSDLACSKTIQDVPEITLTPALFCQPLDIGIDLAGDMTKDISNMQGYPMRSPDNAIVYIGHLLKIGVRSVMIRMDAPAGYASKDALIKRQAEVVQAIRKCYDSNTLDIIVDPFSVALNPDKTWGVISGGKLDYLQTAELFSKLTREFARVGATYVLTLGRFEREVDVTHRTLQQTKTPAKVSSFSTNTETTNAYVYADHGAYALTKQKILVTNYQEMVFRALVDVYEGSSLIVVKPAENLHVLEKFQMLASHQSLLREFLESKVVKAMVHQSVYLDRTRRDMLENLDSFSSKLAAASLGAYTVSGTYFMDTQTQQRKGDAFLSSLLYERFSNIAAVLHDFGGSGLIIDRNAAWYIEHQ